MNQAASIYRRLLRGSSAVSAIAMLGGGLVASSIIATPASAQEYTQGSITGTVSDETGSGVGGATVTVTSVGQGFTRTTTTSDTGGFRFSGLAPGSYTVSVSAAGRPSWRADDVSIIAGQTADITVDLIASGGEDIVVIGSTVTDFTGTTTGVNVDVAELVRTTPINRDLTSVILLAPGTSRGDTAFGNLAAVNGSSVAENAYYINGLNITNFNNYLGSARVPFEFYRSVEVKSGGYPAEFGRATGGIINAVSKAGSNEFVGAVHVNWIPNFLRSEGRDIVSCEADGTCERSTNRGFDTANHYSAILEAGLPIIQDRLFFYGLLEFRRDESITVGRTSGIAFQSESNEPFYAIKVDAYPIDNHHFEFTLFDTRNVTTQTDLSYSEIGGVGSTGAAAGIDEFRSGGVNFVGQYTGTLTDWLTISGAYGRYRDRFETVGIDEGSSTFFFQNASGVTLFGEPHAGLYTGQTATSRSFPYNIEREFYRGDIDLFFNMLGDHHVRAGFDLENNTLVRTTVRTGADVLLAAGFLSQQAYDANAGGAGVALIARPANAGGPVVEVNYINSGGTFDGRNRAFYIQDEWDITDRLTLTVGVRRDDFRVVKPDGSEFITLNGNYAPRIGFTYDLWEGNVGRLYGFYGQYFLPVASNTAFRMGGSEFFFRERFNFSGIDSNGLPILTNQVTTLGTYQTPCPFPLTTQSSGQNCSVTGSGAVHPTDASISRNLEATRQTEFILGYEHRFDDIRVGINYTYRNLDITAEDVAVDAAVIAWCEENGITGCEDTWTGFHQYVLLNPGSDAIVNLNGLDGREVTLAAEDMGYPEASRRFHSVQLTVDRQWDGVWMMGGSYTWSESEGNSEGFVQSDFGQTDSGITQDFDQPGFIPGAFGLLPNHRRHRFKLYGGIAVTPEFTFGGNIRVESPRPLSCFGYNPTDAFANVYGAASHYCGGTLSPRGTAQRSDWVENIDLSARYNLRFGEQTVTLRADVFNLLNSQSVQQRNETGDLDITTGANGLPNGYIPNPNFGQATSYQGARYVRVGFDIEF